MQQQISLALIMSPAMGVGDCSGVDPPQGSRLTCATSKAMWKQALAP
jgi:hypothetical protein